jgi:hypothetical protein
VLSFLDETQRLALASTPGGGTMPSESTAVEIKNRFATEQDYIQRYVDFLRAKTAITDRQITDLVHILKMYKLPQLHRRKTVSGGKRGFTDQHIGDLLKSIKEIAPVVEEAFTKQASVVGQFVDPPKPDLDVHVPDQVGDWIEFFLEKMGDDSTPHAMAAHRQFIKSKLEAETGRDFSTATNKAALEYAITVAVQDCGRRKLDRLRFVLVRLGDLDLLSRLLSSDAQVGVLRQGFILLMTTFDAAVFDLVRVKLRKGFFALIGVFGKQEKVSLQEIGEGGTFEAFRDGIIEEQLKKRYLKDLLFILEALDVKCTDEGAGDRFVQLIEMVLRRNVHVHNRGVVDERYLERDQNGRPKYNLYNLSLGDVACIDESYWELANRLSTQCVTNVAAWAGI